MKRIDKVNVSLRQSLASGLFRYLSGIAQTFLLGPYA